MTRAEQAALKAYPAYNGASEQWIKAHLSGLSEYIQGYEQAEKDTIERAHKWIKLHACMFNNMEEVDLFVDLFHKAMEGE